MATQIEPYTILFPAWYDEQAEFETPSKGHLGGVVVRLKDGPAFELYFTDPVRLQQTLEEDAKAGRPYYSEPGLVVLAEVTTEAVSHAVSGLIRDGYFQHLKPLE